MAHYYFTIYILAMAQLTPSPDILLNVEGKLFLRRLMSCPSFVYSDTDRCVLFLSRDFGVVTCAVSCVLCPV